MKTSYSYVMDGGQRVRRYDLFCDEHQRVLEQLLATQMARLDELYELTLDHAEDCECGLCTEAAELEEELHS